MHPGRSGPIVALVTLGVVAACGGGGGRAAVDAPRLEAMLDLRIGSIDDPETALTRVRGMEVDRAGRIYSAHPQELIVRVHSPEGELLSEIGGNGEGPGELRALGAIGLIGDTLWVHDSRLSRFSFFTPDGRLLRMMTVPIDLGRDPARSPPRPSGLLPDGRLYGSPPAFSTEVALGIITESPVLLMDSTGAPGDTLFRRPVTVWAVQDPKAPRSFGSFRSQPFSDETLFAFHRSEPAYLVVDRTVPGNDETPVFRVSKIAFEGDTLVAREYAYLPRPIDPSAPDSLAREFGERVGRGPLARMVTAAQATDWARENLHVPAHHPPVSRLLPGRDGTIWLRREQLDPDSDRWLVLDASGEVVGEVSLPAGVTVEVADRHFVWGWERDELDIPYLVRYRLRSAGQDVVA